MIAVFRQLSGLSQLMSGLKWRPLATPFTSMYQKREFETNPTQLSQLSGVVIPARQATWTQSSHVDWRACTATQLSRVS
jgi:hypothetical protein